MSGLTRYNGKGGEGDHLVKCTQSNMGQMYKSPDCFACKLELPVSPLMQIWQLLSISDFIWESVDINIFLVNYLKHESYEKWQHLLFPYQ